MCVISPKSKSFTSVLCMGGSIFVGEDGIIDDCSFSGDSLNANSDVNSVSFLMEGGSIAIIGNATLSNIIINNVAVSFTTSSNSNVYANLIGGAIFINQSAQFNNISITQTSIDISPSFTQISTIADTIYVLEILNISNSYIGMNNYISNSQEDTLIQCNFLYSFNSSFEGNYNTISSNYGVIEYSSFISNTAKSSILNIIQCYISNSNFTNNQISASQSSNCEGVVNINGGEIKNSFFDKNSLINCKNEAAVAIFQSTSDLSLLLSNNTFEDNTFVDDNLLYSNLYLIYLQSPLDLNQLYFNNNINFPQYLIYYKLIEQLNDVTISINDCIFEENEFS